MDVASLRIALFSGNYNYVRDGANQALNRLVATLLRQGAAVRIYAPTTDTPAFDPVGDLVSVPSFAIPFRPEYRFASGLPDSIRQDLTSFSPNIVHLSAPDLLGLRALQFAKASRIPAIASLHTRFETYLRYYGLSFLEPAMRWWFRRFYGRCDCVLAPSASMADVIRADRLSDNISIWARGIDRVVFNPEQRSMEFRRTLGIDETDVVIGFLGRLVMEKGLDCFTDVIARLRAAGVPHKVLVIGAGPAEAWFRNQMPEAIFAGHQSGAALGKAVASMDVFFNPSVTETFGNVTLEAMACRLPVVAARATGSANLVENGVTGCLLEADDRAGLALALEEYYRNAALRARHGAAGEAASLAYDWETINMAVVDSYLDAIRRRG